MQGDRTDRPGRQGLSGHLSPGDWVTHPGQPDWGRGQVQSVVGARVTVNFEHVGKVLVNVQQVPLQTLEG